MGEEVPPTYPELINDYYYCLTVNVWGFAGGACYIEHKETVHCCQTGSNIKWLWDNNKICSPGWLICTSEFIGFQSIDNIVGPFEDELGCHIICW